MVEQLIKVLKILEDEIKSENSACDRQQLILVVKPEMEELYNHFANGKVFFKYGKKQRMLESTYIITDSTRDYKIIKLVSQAVQGDDGQNGGGRMDFCRAACRQGIGFLFGRY